MDVLTHHIQEYKKGLRTLVLHTARASNRTAIEKRLNWAMINYYIQEVNEKKINVFLADEFHVIVRPDG